ncbi:MAG TPA: amylo-alpha-1,6-glucosidase, partial [Myxococcaceae bacterium]|nr:amylo-alpha-1,6-glucosidase [Myxococcaceae bacterium]
EDHHYILAAAVHADERGRVLKHGETFALFDQYGNIRPIGMQEEGLYHEGTRHLSSLTLRMNGKRPLLLSSTIVDNALMVVDLTNTDVRMQDDVVLSHGACHIFRSKFLWEAVCYERLRIHNYSGEELEAEFTYEFDADFVDVFEVRGSRRPRRGERHEPRLEGNQVLLGYEGLDGVRRFTRIAIEPMQAQVSATEIRFRLRLRPNEEQSCFLTVSCEQETPRPTLEAYDSAFGRAVQSTRQEAAVECHVQSSNPLVNEWLQRSISDLRMMVTDTPAGPYPYAGVPWYSTAFGRDGIITALQALWLRPSLARGVLKYLAETQATELEPERDAEPGKILHETRRGEMAALGEIPFGRYYGTVDATPLFLLLAGEYHEATGDSALIEELWPKLELALEWMDRYGDRDGDGFVEYGQRARRGLSNQGWKDSFDSVFHADGTLAEGPIALCEVQGYVFAAKRMMARMARMLRRDELADRLGREAEQLRLRFEEAFWCEELSTYALALDGHKRPCRVRTSNPGHCLFAGIVSEERALMTARTLSEPSSFSGWGVRTVAVGERRYNPMSYHNGSIWPHDSAMVALGFARYGLKREALQIFQGLSAAIGFFDLNRMPELFCGFPRRHGEGPTLYPVACSPQAWAAGCVLMLLQAALGMSLHASERRLRLDRPVLPQGINELELRDLRVGEATTDLRFIRSESGAEIQVLRKDGPLDIVILK